MRRNYTRGFLALTGLASTVATFFILFLLSEVLCRGLDILLAGS